MSEINETVGVYTVHQLEELARHLASRTQKTSRGRSNRLLARLEQNEEVLRNAYRLVSASIAEGQKTTPAGDWLLDNFHLIEDQIKTSKLHLPKQFSRELPLVQDPVWQHLPRIYILAQEIINHSDGRLELSSMMKVVEAYQEVLPLRLGELWAFPIMLRLSLIDNLRKISESIAASFIDQRNAKFWADRMVATSKEDPSNLIIDIADLARSDPRLSSAFVSEFARRIQTHCSSPSLPIGWIEQRLSTEALSIEQHQFFASQGQAHDQISMSNSISSLRVLNDMDWRVFVEKLSPVNAMLMKDPSGTFSKMDFLSRDIYRHAVEDIAKYTNIEEITVAKLALDFTLEKQKEAPYIGTQLHIGSVLYGRDRQEFEKHLKISYPFSKWLPLFVKKYPLSHFFIGMSILSLLLAWLPLRDFYFHYLSASYSILLFILLLVPASQLALVFLNWLGTKFLKPYQWVRLDYSKEIPDDARTIVIIPTLLTDEAEVQKLISDLEIRFLGNKQSNILFALLTDFSDAKFEKMPTDDHLLALAETGISNLNKKYSTELPYSAFYLFHRERSWNRHDKLWMGYERKRGKIKQFNRFLLSGGQESPFKITGPLSNLSDIRYVITLDSDSTLPRDAATQMIATIAHPLNQPKLDEKSCIVKEGYAILQPRVTIQLQENKASYFSKIFSDDFGIDPYTKCVSDVYQDLFCEGSYIGKGIYDLRAFESSLAERFPENRVLSHDLLESSFARSGLVSDIQLVEQFPTNYLSDAYRRHRWMRGDWQIASWALAWVPNAHKKYSLNPLSLLSRWKIFDNVRRSLAAPVTFSLFLIFWLFFKPVAWTLSLYLLGYLLFPHLFHAVQIKSWLSPAISLLRTAIDASKSLIKALVLFSVQIIFLPFEAFLSFDAIVRCLYRLKISGKRLLEWQISTSISEESKEKLSQFYLTMWFSPAIGTLLLTSAFLFENMFSGVIPFAVCWLLAPSLAWKISKQVVQHKKELTQPQTIFLRALARQIWHFFDTFVTETDNWLPPDNFQEFPEKVIAHRTSPTNIGLSLVSTLAAYDFAYITLDDLLKRTSDTLDTIDKLEKFKGHLFNWYDTTTLRPLEPLYVSTVDSGNLLGSYLVLREGLAEIVSEGRIEQRSREGLQDLIYLIEREIENSKTTSFDRETSLLQTKQLSDILTEDLSKQKIQTPTDAALLFQKIKNCIEDKSFLPTEKHPVSLSKLILKLSDQVNKHLAFINIYNGSAISFSTKKDLQVLMTRIDSNMKQDYSFLYNKTNRLLSIGYHVGNSRLDPSYYDLLASEARLASFLAIAFNWIPQEHWFALGRQFVMAEGVSSLLSWSGSMFEYLMPSLIMPSFEDTLIDEACKQCVKSQIRYGKTRKVPWGISESGYNLTDAQYNYQYRAFGVPGLGIKRGLDQDLVIAPYASLMAVMVDPQASCSNLLAMADAGYCGEFGFYEAVDFTPGRVPAGEKSVLIKSFMSHHQGMGFLALAHHLLDQPMQKRMRRDPNFRATELLLQEKIPKSKAQFSNLLTETSSSFEPSVTKSTFRTIKDLHKEVPDIHLLGNGRYHVMVTSSGTGYSTWNNLAITRWREDRTKDEHGYFIYITDPLRKKSWSAGFQPLQTPSHKYEAIFSEGRAEYRRSDDFFETHTEIAVSPDDDTELRRVTISNESDQEQTLEITTYAEVVLAPLADDIAHPAFSNLFVQSEVLENDAGLLCHRRSREPKQKNPWLYHSMVVHGGKSKSCGIETDRSKFIGRNQNLGQPNALFQELSESSGSVLDPVVAIRKQVTIPARQSVIIDCILGVTEERSHALELVDRFKEKQIADRVLELSWTHGHVLLQQLNCSTNEAILFGTMASHLIFGGCNFRCEPQLVKANQKPRSAFWSYGISGDLPILLLRLQSADGLLLLRQIVKGHDYWRRKGLAVDLCIWNESPTTYRQEIYDKIIEIIGSISTLSLLDHNGGIFIRRPEQMPEEDKIIFLTASRLIISESFGTLDDQITERKNKSFPKPKLPPLLRASNKRVEVSNAKEKVKPNLNLIYDNSLGGFCESGKEYVLHFRENERTPTPWVNVLANPQFGTLVSESGSAYTWSENSHEHRLTPWSNDPVSDPSGEAAYLRDEISGKFWLCTPMNTASKTSWIVRHGFGYSTFQASFDGLDSVMTTFVHKDDPLKFLLLKITNESTETRSLSLTNFYEIVLGDQRSKSASQIVTDYDATNEILKARNVYSSEFSDRFAFLSATEKLSSVTCDRYEFIGCHRRVTNPAALERTQLSGRTGALYDPCLAMRAGFSLEPGESKEIAFIFGASQESKQIKSICQRFKSVTSVHLALAEVKKKWQKILNQIQIETPDPSLNLLGNGWLLYQTISSRLWGRTGFYQSGGAYGFRDQLQDMLAVVYCAPELVREHILLCASRQFHEGDVQHWWHPPQGKGVRTSISDDLLWLPHVLCHYLKVTHDFSILDVEVAFLRAPLLQLGQESDYSLPAVSDEKGTIYEHCVRALKHSFKFGRNGLPLMGSGDWNDGMNHIGLMGKGESVWLGFFLVDTLTKFADLAKNRKDLDFTKDCEEITEKLKISLNKNAWDGEWFRRAYFDDGTPLGSAASPECRIDSLPQSWSVLAKATDSYRANQAMEAVYRELVIKDVGMIKLFNPPFDHEGPNPGYISGYVPGVRENGGQYTHAAIWVILAFAKLGNLNRALELLKLINPIEHSNSKEKMLVYKAEPYVIAADVYGNKTHLGRGGWTWYTGSAALYYRALLEGILGFDLRGSELRIHPQLPDSWPSINLNYSHGSSLYRIEVKRSSKLLKSFQASFDNLDFDGIIQLKDDGSTHDVVFEV